MIEPVRAAWRHVLLATLVAGSIDIGYALAMNALRGGTAQRLLQFIATGWLGKASFDGGMATAALGLASHYAIIFVAAALFLAASRRIAWLRAHPCICGMLYGLGIFLVMNFVVVPLSAVPIHFHYRLWPTIGDLASHVFGVGLVISLVTRRAIVRA